MLARYIHVISFYHVEYFSLVEDKERKIKEAEEYRQFLIGQMESKKGQDHVDALNEKIFLQHRLLANNETDRETKSKVETVNVAEKQSSQ